MEEDFDREIKVVVLGNGGVGKTSMIRRFCKGIFTDEYKKTIGVDFLEKAQFVDALQEEVRFMLWDTGASQVIAWGVGMGPSAHAPRSLPAPVFPQLARRSLMPSRALTTVAPVPRLSRSRQPTWTRLRRFKVGGRRLTQSAVISRCA